MMRRRTRAFTMLELVIGLALGVVVIGAAVVALATVLRENRRQRVHSELQRDAEFTLQLLTQEIRIAGSGVPVSRHIDTGFGVTTTFDVRRVLVAGAQELLVLGDLPRPDANYPAFGYLHDRATEDVTRIAWHTENNGTCVPPGCALATSSLFFPGGENCTTATSRTCPWYGRLRAGDAIQVVDGGGQWGHTSLASLTPVTSGTLNIVAADLGATIDASGQWTNNINEPPTATYGQGWVTSLDRVAFEYDAGAKTVLRTQCWGDPDPDDGNWPGPAATVLPASLSVNPAGSASICVGPEVVARNVIAFTFRYLDGPGTTDLTGANSATLKNAIRRIEWTMVLEKNDATFGRPVTYTTVGSVRLQNIQGGEP